jgi:hypothetical protein
MLLGKRCGFLALSRVINFHQAADGACCTILTLKALFLVSSWHPLTQWVCVCGEAEMVEQIEASYVPTGERQNIAGPLTLQT